MTNIINNMAFRQWMYRVATAVLVVLAGAGVIGAVEQENFGLLAAAVLNVGGGVVTAIASANTKPKTKGKGTPTVREEVVIADREVVEGVYSLPIIFGQDEPTTAPRHAE